MDKFAAAVNTAMFLSRPPAPHESAAAAHHAPPPMAQPGRRLSSQQLQSGAAGQQLRLEHAQRLEERIDSMQDSLTRTQEMIRDLSALVHRQLKMTNAKQKNRAVSENFSLGNYQLFPSSHPSPPVASLLRASFSRSDPADGEDDSHLMRVDDSLPKEIAEEPNNNSLISSMDKVLAIRRTSSARTAMTTPSVDGANDQTSARRLSFTDRTMSKTKSILNAVTFVSELQVSSVKQAKRDREQPLTRRISVNSMVVDKTLSGKNSNLARWSRNFFKLFKCKVEPTSVAPDSAQLLRDTDRLHPLTLRHDSCHRSKWDAIVLLMVCVDMVFTPLSLGFDYNPTYVSNLNMLGIVVFFVDFIVNIFSSYQNERSEVVSGPSNTARHYLLSVWALPDFLSWFPFEYVTVTKDKGRFLSFAKVIRLVKVSQLARRLHSAKKAGILRFLNLFGIVFLVSHCLTCYWQWAAVEWRRNQDDMEPISLGKKYSHAWSLVIGCLNASPPTMYSTVEELSVAFFMLIGNVLQASVFGSVAVVISSFDEEEAAYNKKLISTYERCKFLGIPEPLSKRIQGFYENLYRETKSVSSDADSFIYELSPSMICEVKFQLYRDMIKQIPFLSAKKIDPTVIELLILHLRTVIYMQDDILIRKGEFGDWMGFIGSKGLVGVLDPRSITRKIIRVLRKGDYFGEMALLHRAKRSTTAVALTWVQIHVLCRVDLDDVKEQYPSQAQILEDEINKYMKSKVTYR
uniref:Cyclic nucleotide-binding domain-containing protein n=1 Tax=Globisporangium ultimum (strain ATCC 200006 / CBS 805.95 / DAOM BR144) TaxID=431595 RepID=K3XAA2_GLOUD